MDARRLDYDLPPSAIAQLPAEPRDSARLLVDRGLGASPQHRAVSDLPELVGPEDLIVVNDTRVLPARLRLHKPTGGAVEVLLLERRPDGSWEALVRPSRRVRSGTRLTLGPAQRDGDAVDVGAGDVTVEVGDVLGDDGRRLVQVHGSADEDDLAVLARAGEVPLPPYIRQRLTDPDRYQTVYANRPASVAAPTAGLHLTAEVIDRCRAAGATVANIELVVGLGTFRPITVGRVEDHRMHPERYRIPAGTVALLEAGSAGRVLAVGTTVVRALESWAVTGEVAASTSLFIHGDHRFQVVDRLLTNFHVPRSSLLAMVEAFIGPRWRYLYTEALAQGYRFLSFGDAMLLNGASVAG